MIRVRQIKIDVKNDLIDEIKKNISKKLKINVNDIKGIRINKKSLDARYKPQLYSVYEVDIDVINDALKTNFKKCSAKINTEGIIKKFKSSIITCDDTLKIELKDNQTKIHSRVKTLISCLNGTNPELKNDVHIPIIYGDFFFVEAMLKLKGNDFFIW